MKSEIEVYWEAICAKAGINKPWNSLHPQEQMIVLQSVNMLINVLFN